MPTEPATAVREADAAARLRPTDAERSLPSLILVEDQLDAQEALARIAESEGFAVRVASNLTAARNLIKAERPSLVITDLRLPDGNGIDLVRELRDSPPVDVVVVTGHASIETAIEALRLGAFDYVTKPVDVPHLQRVLGNMRRTLLLRGEIGQLRDELRSLGRFGQLIGVSPAMQTVYDLLGRVGPTDASVLLTGESGTGKELAAMTLHDLSNRRDKPFLAINCGAVPPNMIESELFGHERGSFTGAVQRHTGYFERAAGGTLFLDEIAEMPAELQVRLLRVLESKKLVRVGGEKDVPVDVRVIAATNRNPEAAIADGRLRGDLFYRLAVVAVQLPPLRDRGDDIRILAEHFLSAINAGSDRPKRLMPDAIDALCAHAWPGNVRELKNVMQSASIMADKTIEARHLPFAQRRDAAPRVAPPASTVTVVAAPAVPAARAVEPVPETSHSTDVRIPVGTTAAEAERRLILATLDGCGGNKKEAARLLSVSLKTMYNRLRAYADPRGDDADNQGTGE